MRLRSTAAAALLASFALVLPTAGQSLANDRHDLGEIHYRFTDDDGDVRRRTIEPADLDTCYRLTGTSRNHPAFAVQNDTDALVLVFRGDSCGGEAQEVLRPGEHARDLNARSVFLKPDGHHGGHHDGRDDDWDDEDRSVVRPGQGRAMTPGQFMDDVFRSIG
ncbi:hypothetical protein EF910_18545 [Streptomyces sp. WAC07149]|uniref:hypothetical protein n=1 Tax=Streptomyces sp. WAC07149 TaxID=2487425 RepID=UPI000F7B52EE|nr:hypothetical protein [Streptomyces sp. WAC07149]RST04133.1 hypothetical protein EF910_18545 [Streptomyces sp. WAC07149]